MLVILSTALCALGRETEEQLLQRIQSEQNPVKKAKDEIKLANLKFTQVHDAYSQGHIEAGIKLLGTFVDTLKTSWKFLQESGRKASKQPEGFRELDISLRENGRALQDLARTVSYFDRAPLEDAAQQLDQMRDEVLHALFPGGNPRTLKGSPPPQTTSPGNPPGVR
jgi:predicted Zn-dependent protease